MKPTPGSRTRRLLAPLAGALVAALAVSVGMSAAATKDTAPKNTEPPTISGTPSEGQTLKADAGTWTGTKPMDMNYQWLRCDTSGGSCSAISGATGLTYTLKSVDNGNTLRFRVTAKNGAGSDTATSVPTAVVAATPKPAPTGCPKTAQGSQAVDVKDVSTPARLQIDGFTPSPSVITAGTASFTVRFHVSDTCGQPVQGAQVYATAVPYHQVSVPAEQATGADGSVTLTFNRQAGFPASRNQQLMVIFVRARKAGENLLAGVSTRRLISLPVNLHR